MRHSIKKEVTQRDGLKLHHIVAYSVGHMMNDLSVAMNFFFAWYLEEVIELDPKVTGLIWFVGFVSDGISTVVVGLLSDKSDTRCGKR